MSNSRRPPKSRPAPISIRFSESEKVRLRARAGDKPLGTFIRAAVLGEDVDQRRSVRSPVRDGAALGQILGLLGKSRIANNLIQLAKAAHLGALPVLPNTDQEIQAACAAVQEMRTMLLRSLGVEIIDSKPLPPAKADFATNAELSP